MLQVSQRPLQATAVDAVLFVNRRPELEMLERSVRLGFNSLVLGERGAGKTSLLHQLERRLVEAGVDSRFVQVGGASEVEGVVELLHVAVHGRRRDPTAKLLASFDGEQGIAVDIAQLSPADGRHLVMLLDSVASPEIVHGLFGRQRDEMWQLPITWVVSGNRGERRRYLEPPADSFFDAIVEVDELSVAEATELLRRRAQNAATHDPAREVLLAVAAGLGQRVAPRTPRNLLAAAREVLLSDDDPTQWVTNQYALQARASALSRSAGMLFTELMDLGPVSSSDKRLLDRLGWTRARASQVFSQLEDAGLVVVAEEAPDGPGRPRKLYAPATRFHTVAKAEEGP